MHAHDFLFLILGISFYGILAWWKMSKNPNKRPIEDVDESSNDDDDSLITNENEDGLPQNSFYYITDKNKENSDDSDDSLEQKVCLI